MDILHTLLILIFCHLVGDYVLQSDIPEIDAEIERRRKWEKGTENG